MTKVGWLVVVALASKIGIQRKETPQRRLFWCPFWNKNSEAFLVRFFCQPFFEVRATTIWLTGLQEHPVRFKLGPGHYWAVCNIGQLVFHSFKKLVAISHLWLPHILVGGQDCHCALHISFTIFTYKCHFVLADGLPWLVSGVFLYTRLCSSPRTSVTGVISTDKSACQRQTATKYANTDLMHMLIQQRQ